MVPHSEVWVPAHGPPLHTGPPALASTHCQGLSSHLMGPSSTLRDTSTSHLHHILRSPDPGLQGPSYKFPSCSVLFCSLSPVVGAASRSRSHDAFMFSFYPLSYPVNNFSLNHNSLFKYLACFCLLNRSWRIQDRLVRSSR